MKLRHLITTADERTWSNDHPVLFLGEWCRLYNRKIAWEKLDAEVVPYHWDDRAKLYSDYQYLQEFYEQLLRELMVQLNQIHGVGHSLRYWRILLGPWLGYFVQMLFDRWQMIHESVKNFSISSTSVLNIREETVVPQNMTDFIRLFVADLWNHWIYKEIIQRYTDIYCDNKRLNGEGARGKEGVAFSTSRFKTMIKDTLRGCSSLLAQRNKYFFVSSCLGRFQLQLECKLRQLPGLWCIPSLPEFPVDFEMRSNLHISCKERNRFEKFVFSIIPKQIPTVYLEGYKTIAKKTETVPWPSRPKLIFTSNPDNLNEFVKVWAAQKIENGTKLVLGQHGGHYGAGKWSFLEEHEIAIADRYLSWGWRKDGFAKVKPLSAVKLLSTSKIRSDVDGGLLLVMAELPRYSYWMYSIPVASQLEQYFEEQFCFVDRLTPVAAKALVVRLFPYDYGWCQKLRWQDRLTNVRFDSMKRSMSESLQHSRLFVGTYNATTFLETFTANFPTIMYWNPKLWELRPSAQPYYDKLRHVGILHDTPESAAAKVNEIFDAPLDWWNQSCIQDAKDEFCNEFAYITDNYLKEWSTELQSYIA